MTSMPLVGSFLHIDWQMLRASSQVMQWQGAYYLFQRNYSLIWPLSMEISSSRRFSSRARSSTFFLISTTSRSISGSSLPPTHLIVFFCSFSTQLMPSRTLVMSQILLFWTPSSSTALLRSMVPLSLCLMRWMNFLVSTERLLSCLPLPEVSEWVRLGVWSSSSSSESAGSSDLTGGCFFSLSFLFMLLYFANISAREIDEPLNENN